MGACEVLFNLLELAVLVDDGFEISVLLGKFLETRSIRDNFGSGRAPGSFPDSGRRADRVFSESVRAAIGVPSLQEFVSRESGD